MDGEVTLDPLVESHGQNTLRTTVVPLTKAVTHRRIDQTQCSCIVDDLKATLVGCLWLQSTQHPLLIGLDPGFVELVLSGQLS